MQYSGYVFIVLTDGQFNGNVCCRPNLDRAKQPQHIYDIFCYLASVTSDISSQAKQSHKCGHQLSKSNQCLSVQHRRCSHERSKV